MKNKKLVIIFLILVIILIVLLINIFSISKKDKNMNSIVVLETTKGNIEIELDTNHAPITTTNFLEYVNSGFYDGLVFHRVMKGFMIQGGGFTTAGIQKETNSPIVLRI